VRPLGDTATPAGEQKVAAAPMPLAVPAAPLPARVLTAPPPAVTARTRRFPTSATYTVPVAGFTATATGLLSCALLPAPLAAPAA
jgi:hypothetical protein